MTGLRKRAITGAIGCAVALGGCASDPGPVGMTQAQLETFTATYVGDDRTVQEALELAPPGTIGLMEVRVAEGAPFEHASYPEPPEHFRDWVVVGMCGAPDALPSVELAAVAPTQLEAFMDAPPFHLVCDGPAGEPAGE